MEYERSDSGILLPEQPRKQADEESAVGKTLKSASLGSIINLLMVLIQLFTVWILWKTYQDTVIPTRQKELLSEQLAQLELDQKATMKAIAAAKSERDKILTQANEARSKVETLTLQTQELAAESDKAKIDASRSFDAASDAKTAAAKAKSNLEGSQWSVYYQTASVTVGIPRSKWIRKSGALSRRGLGTDDRLAEFKTRLVEIEKIWPNLTEDAAQVAFILRNEQSQFYPKWMSEQFASYFETTASKATCAKPDFVQILNRVEEQYNAAAAPARKVALEELAEDEELKKQAAERHVKLVYPPDHNKRMVDLAISNATYKIFSDQHDKFDELAGNCYERFEQIGDKFFSARKVQQPTYPQAVEIEFNQ